jgi:hypothetical protein
MGRSQGRGPSIPNAVVGDVREGSAVPDDIGRLPPAGRLSAKGYFLTYSQVGDASADNIHSLINSFEDKLISEYIFSLHFFVETSR